MLSEALSFISNKINLACFPDDSPVKVVLGNATVLYEPGKINQNVLLTLVNIEEEVILRNPEHFVKRGNSVVYKNPPIFLNLTLLFGAYRYTDDSRAEEDYKSSIKAIQKVIGFFQAHRVFDHLNAPDLDAAIEKLTFEMVNMNIEQLHHLWGMLGGKYLPSVAYKMRLVMIDMATETGGPVISQIIIDDKLIPQ